MEVITLTLTFVDDEIVMEPGEQLVFGRGGDLRLDEGDDHYLHRLVGRFLWNREMWWLENLGRSIDLVLRDPFGADDKTVRPGQPAEPLTRQAGSIWLSSGPHRYQLEYVQSLDPTPTVPRPVVTEGEETEEYGVAPLGDGQRLLLTALAEPRLRLPGSRAPLPANNAVSERFGWPSSTFNRRLDGLCRLFAELGVAGLVGDEDHRATGRREVLIDHVIKHHMITEDDLSIL